MARGHPPFPRVRGYSPPAFPVLNAGVYKHSRGRGTLPDVTVGAPLPVPHGRPPGVMGGGNYRPILGNVSGGSAPRVRGGKSSAGSTAADVPFVGYLTPEQILAQATAQVHGAYQPQIDMYNTLIGQAQAANQAKITLLRGLLAQAATSLGGLPQSLADIYQQAAQGQGQLAQGFSSDLAQTLQGEADKTNALLASIGAPQGQMIPGSQAQGVGDVAYGLGGYLNAASLEGQGLRAAESAAQLPGQLWQQGLGLISGYQQDETQAEQQYRAQIAEIAAKGPQAIQQAVADINKQQADLLAAAKTDAYRTAQINQGALRIKLDIAKTQTDNSPYVWTVNANGDVVVARGRDGKPIPSRLGLTGGAKYQHVTLPDGSAGSYDRTTGTYYNAAGDPIIPAAGAGKLITIHTPGQGTQLYDPVTQKTVLTIPGDITHLTYQKVGDKLVALWVDAKGIPRSRAVATDWTVNRKLALQARGLDLSQARLAAQMKRDHNTQVYRRIQTSLKVADRNSKMDGTVWGLDKNGNPVQLLDDKGKPVPTIKTSTDAAKASLAWARVYGQDPKTGLLTLDGQKAIEAATGYQVDQTGKVVTDPDGKPVMTVAGAKAAAPPSLHLQHVKMGNGKILTFDPGNGTFHDPSLGNKVVDPNTYSGGPTGKPPTAGVIKKGWDLVKQGVTGWWASQTDPNNPISTDQFRSLVKDAGYKSVAGFVYDVHNAKTPADAQALLDKVGVQYMWGDPMETYLDLIHSGIPAKRAWMMVRKYLPGWQKVGQAVGKDYSNWGAGWFGPKSRTTQATTSTTPTKRAPGGQYLPVNTAFPTGSEFAQVDAEGAPDASGVTHHAALDWMAPAGSAVISPIGGKIIEVKSANGDYSGQVFGGVVKVEGPNGRVWVFRHVDPHGVTVGQRVKAGQQIASVANWTDNPGSTHTHVELWKTLKGGYHYENMIDPYSVFAKGQYPSQTTVPPAAGTGAKGAAADMKLAMAPAGARTVAQRMALKHGWSIKQWKDLNTLINSESGWDYRAWHNPGTGRADRWKGDAPPPHGAFGIGQALGHDLPPDYTTNPIVQIQWMFDYIRDRYNDDPSQALAFKLNHGGLHGGWY